jgi:hypothetical protein
MEMNLIHDSSFVNIMIDRAFRACKNKKSKEKTLILC